VCKCHLPLLRLGDDECIFKQSLLSSRSWVINGVRGLRKKTEGAGVMVSAFVDEQRGFGFPMTEEEIEKVNAYREIKYGKPMPLEGSPGVRFLVYGKNNEGYWTGADMAKQLRELLDALSILYAGWQFCIEFDWSSGHAAHRPGALSVHTMNVNYGGKQSIPHASKITAGCLGSEPGRTLEVGDMQYFYFRSAEETGAAPDGPPVYAQDVDEGKYRNEAKGTKQVLWERGLYKEGMKGTIGDDDLERDKQLSMTHVLSECEDFRTEITLLEEIAWRYGHIVRFTPKGHCELAGIGIEYNWGKMKKFYRRENKPTGPDDFYGLVVRSMSREVVPVLSSRRFARKARAYKRAYRSGESNEHADLEAMVKSFKTHRNALDFAGAFVRDN
jgi:hypothetical protein